MKKTLIALISVICTMVALTSCGPTSSQPDKQQEMQNDEETLSSSPQSEIDDSINLINPFDTSQSVTVTVLEFTEIIDVSAMDSAHFIAAEGEIYSEDGRINPLLGYPGDVDPAFYSLKQTILNNGNEDITIYANSSELLTSQSAAGFKMIYFDMATAARDANGFFKFTLPAKSELTYSVGFIVEKEELRENLLYCVNPFAVTRSEQNDLTALNFVGLKI